MLMIIEGYMGGLIIIFYLLCILKIFIKKKEKTARETKKEWPWRKESAMFWKSNEKTFQGREDNKHQILIRQMR